MRVRLVVGMLATVIALYSQSLEVTHADPPFGNGRTLAGTVKNVSGSSIPGDIDVYVFVFGERGVFLGEGRDSIKGPLPTNSSAEFYINVKSAGLGMSKYYMQFDSANSSLPYRVIGGVERTPLTDAGSGVQEISGVHRVSTSSENCKLRMIHITESLSSSGTQLRLAGRFKNTSNDDSIAPYIRITFFDINGSYLGEDTEVITYGLFSGFARNAEKAFSFRLQVPDGSVTYQLDFVDGDGIKIPHCAM